MRIPIHKFRLLAVFLCFFAVGARATVTVTGPTNSLSADSASNAVSPSWTSLGAITITEGANGDFARGTAVTLILAPPTGFQFNAAQTPSVAVQGGGTDLSSLSATVTSSNLTVKFTVSSTTHADTLTIGGTTALQVRPTDDGPLATTGLILRPSGANGGTATITGLSAGGGVSCGKLSEVAGAYTQMQLLMPGETAAPGTVSGKTGTPTAQTAGTAFNVTVNATDANWNVISTNDTIKILSSDPSANLPANAALSAGSQTFSVTFKTTPSQTVTATNVTHGTKTANTGTSTTVNPAAANKLVIATQPSGSATAGVNFAQQPVINIEDTFGNIRTSDTLTITAARSGGSGTLQGTTSLAAVGGVATFTDLNHQVANTITISFSAAGVTSATSGNVVVSHNINSQLQVIMPGETAAPGTVSGKTGTPTAQTAGTSFNVTVNAVDAYWNLVNTVTDTVGITSSDPSATLPASAALVAGTKNNFAVTFKTSPSQTVTATDSTHGTITANTGTSTTVNPASASKLVIATQPSSTATAGVSFAQQPVINIEDTFGNIRTSDTLTITAARSGGAGTLQGTTALAAVGGVATFTNLNHQFATNITIQFTSGALTAATSGTVSVSANTNSQLQVLMPGETTAPATVSGKTGTATAQTAGTAFNVTVNAVDAYWNLVNTVTDSVGITSSDANAVLPANANLVAGTRANFSVTFKAAGSQTVTASDLTVGAVTANTGSTTTVNAGPVAKLQLLMPGETAAPGSASGKTGTPTAQTAGTSFNVTVNAVDANWNLVNTVTDTVGITSSDPSATLPASAPLVAGTKNNFAVTFKTTPAQTVTATDSTHGTVTANTGTSTTVNPAAASKLVISTQPSGTATAGVAFAQQPVILIEDTFGNLRSSDTLTVTAARSGGSGTLLGTTSIAAVGGVATFLDLNHPVANTITIQFSSGGLTTATSGNVVVSAGGFSQLQVLMPGESNAPGTGSGKSGSPTAQTAGAALTVRINAVDPYFNQVSTTTDTVGYATSDANAVLPGNIALVNGTNSISLTFKTAAVQSMTVNDVTNPFKGVGVGSSVTVNPGTIAKLQLLMPGETASPGSATGKTGTPSAQTAGTSFNVTVNSVDAWWNVVNTNDTIAITSSDANAALPANAALVSGVKTFSVTLKTAGTPTVTASDSTHAGTTASTSPATVVNPGTLAALQILLPGETNAPGTVTGKTGSPSAQTAGTGFTVRVSAVDSLWNIISTNDLVTLASSDIYAGLPATAALTNGTNSLSVTNKAAGTQNVTGADQTTRGINGTSANFTVNVAAFSQLLVLMPGETSAPGAPTGKTGSPTSQTAGTALSVTVNAADAYWNLISTNDTVHLTSSDANATIPANAALAAGTHSFSMTFKTAASQTVTASDVTHVGIGTNTGTATTVNAGTFVAMQLILPGQTAAPGTATGVTGTPSAQTSGVAFSVEVNAVDANWNVVPSAPVADTIAIYSSDANGTISAGSLVLGTGTLSQTLNTAGTATVTVLDYSDFSKTAQTSPSVTVTAGSFSQLQLLMPGETSSPGSLTGKTGTPTAQTAGTAFNLTVNAVDANWNVVSSASADTIAIALSDPNASSPANANLSSGTKTFSVTFKTAGTWTATATDQTHGTITASIGAATTVNAGAISRLQLLMPGETAAPGTGTGKTGSPSVQNTGYPFNVTVRSVDANWNLVSTNDTIHITSSDGSATLPANAALASGSQTFSVTFKTSGSQTVTASDTTHAGTTANTGSSTTVDATGTFNKLQVLLPGETAAPGSGTGKTGTPTAQTVGVPFTITVNAVDANWNPISTNDTIHITSSDGTATLPPNAALVTGTKTFSMTLNATGSKTITASDVTHGGITANTSASVTVNPLPVISQLLVLLPGETFAPGTAGGKTGSPTDQTAASSFTVTVKAVDGSWNLVNTNDIVRITSSDAYAVLPATNSLTSGSATFTVTLKTAAAQTVTAADVTHTNVTNVTNGISSSLTVDPGAYTKVQILMPGQTAVPGSPTGQSGSPTAQMINVPFNITVNAVDANWNVVPTAPADIIALTSTDPNASATGSSLSSGTQTIALTFETTGLQTVTAQDFSDNSKTSETSPQTVVNAGPYVKLQILVPGMTAVPGSPSGSTGTPTAQNTDNPVTVTVNAVDANWNVVSSVTNIVSISCAGVSATLPANAALVGGTGTFSVGFDTRGTGTLTASDVTDPTKTNNTSPSITVNAGAFAQLQLLMPGETAAAGTVTGKTGTPTAQTAGTAFSVTVNAVDGNWNIISTNDTVHIASSDGSATLPANAALSAGTQTFNMTNKTSGNQTVTASDTTHGGISANTGTATLINPAAANKLVIGTQPSSTATAGVAFAQQPVIFIEDTYGNIRSNDSLTITASRTSGTPGLSGTTNLNAVNGVASFTNLSLFAAGTITVTFASSGLTSATSANVVVSAGPFSQLQVLMPGETAAPNTFSGKTGTPTAQTAGTPFTVTVNAVDANWVVVNTNDTVAIGSSDANALLPANAALVSGTKTFSVTWKTAGSSTITASDVTHVGISANTGTATTVNPSVFAQLQLLVPGMTAAPGTATGFTGSPLAQTAGSLFTVTVNAVDVYYNVVNTNDAVGITTSDLNGILPPNAALASGSGTYNLTLKTPGTQTATASDSTHIGITNNTVSLTVSTGPFSQLQILAPGETAAPGTATGKTGSPSAQTAGASAQFTVNAVDSVWNIVSTNDTVSFASSDANAVLPANFALVNGTNSANVTFKTAASQTVTASDVTNPPKSPGVSSSVTVNAGPVTSLQLLMPGETAAPGTLSGKTGTPTAQTAGTSLNVTVNAVDTYWNLVNTVTDTVAISSTDANASLPANAALVAGTKNNFALTFKTAGSQTVTATDVTHGTNSPNTGTATVVSAGSFTKLQLLMPGETAAPGSASGKTGTPSAQTAFTPLTVIVNAVDANWNLSSTATDTVKITSSDGAATLPANAALAAGTQSFSVTFGTPGTATVTATDFTNGGKSPNTSPSVTIAKATPSITWTNPAAISYGVVLSGTQLNASSGVAGTYVYTPVSGTLLNASNNQVLAVTLTPTDTTHYSNATASVLINVLQSGSSNAVTTSTNPVPPGHSITFTATLTSLTAGSGAAPGGTVQFLTNGVAAGSPVTISGGTASFSTSSLSHGSNSVTAQYAGNANYTGSTNSLSPKQVINTPPVAGTAAFSRNTGTSLLIKTANLLTNATDADGDTLTLSSVGATSTNGATVAIFGSFVFYTPPATNPNVTDRFTYTVADSFGGSSTGTVVVSLPTSTNQTQNIISILMTNGTSVLSLAGIPGQSYYIQATTNLPPTASWSNIGTNTAGTNGLFQFTDTQASNYTSRYYRTAIP